MTDAPRPIDSFKPTVKELAQHSATDANVVPRSSGDFRCTCPNCGSELWDKECKSRCPRCHFFTDCSDPW